jgi:signal transduction histidine kinase
MRAVPAEHSKATALHRQAAQERAEELAKANDALQATVDATSQVLELNELVPKVLAIIAGVFGTENCGLFENLPSGEVRLRYWHGEGRTLLPAELLQLDEEKHSLVRQLAAGFTPPTDYLGQDGRIPGTVFLDHVKGTSVPEFDQWAVSNGCDLELNIGIASQGLRCATLCVYRARQRPFTRREIVLAEALARQIGLALQVTKLSQAKLEAAVAREREKAAQERAEELERMARALQETIDSFGKISDLDQLVPVVLQIVARTLGAISCAVYEHRTDIVFLRFWYVDGRVLHPHELLEVDKERFGLIRRLAGGFTVPIDYLGTTVVERTRAVIVDHDAGSAVPEFDTFARNLGWDYELNVPIVSDSRAIGALCVFRSKTAGAYTLQEIRFAESLSAQLALALLAKDLATQAQERAIEAVVAREREQAAQLRAGELSKANWILRRVNERLSGETNYRSVLGLLLAELSSIVGNTSGGIFTFDANTYALRFVLGYEDGQIVEELVGHPHGHADKPADARVFLGWTDPATRPSQEFIKMTPGNAAHPSNEWHSSRRHRLLVRTPLIANEEPVGTLCLAFTSEGPLDPLKLELCNAVAQQATLALQLARLSDQARQADVARERETTILQERSRFAGQIHDTLAQGFTGVLLHLEALRVRTARGEKVTVDELQSIRKIAALGLAEARRSALAIRPLALDGRDLSTALQQLTERSAVPGLLNCRWSLGGVPRPISPVADEALLNIAHEAVSNAIRHADAGNIHITLAFDPDGVSLLVRDDGVGFDASDSRLRGHTFGLRSMRERAKSVGGDLNVVSRRGEGTTVTVHLPTA